MAVLHHYYPGEKSMKEQMNVKIQIWEKSSSPSIKLRYCPLQKWDLLSVVASGRIRDRDSLPEVADPDEVHLWIPQILLKSSARQLKWISLSLECAHLMNGGWLWNNQLLSLSNKNVYKSPVINCNNSIDCISVRHSHKQIYIFFKNRFDILN